MIVYDRPSRKLSSLGVTSNVGSASVKSLFAAAYISRVPPLDKLCVWKGRGLSGGARSGQERERQWTFLTWNIANSNEYRSNCIQVSGISQFLRERHHCREDSREEGKFHASIAEGEEEKE